jgi:hypothetical protein
MLKRNEMSIHAKNTKCLYMLKRNEMSIHVCTCSEEMGFIYMSIHARKKRIAYTCSKEMRFLYMSIHARKKQNAYTCSKEMRFLYMSIHAQKKWDLYTCLYMLERNEMSIHAQKKWNVYTYLYMLKRKEMPIHAQKNWDFYTCLYMLKRNEMPIHAQKKELVIRPEKKQNACTCSKETKCLQRAKPLGNELTLCWEAVSALWLFCWDQGVVWSSISPPFCELIAKAASRLTCKRNCHNQWWDSMPFKWNKGGKSRRLWKATRTSSQPSPSLFATKEAGGRCHGKDVICFA